MWASHQSEDRDDLASTEITDCADEAASPELWKLYAFAYEEELGCQVTLPSGARFSVEDKTMLTRSARSASPARARATRSAMSVSSPAMILGGHLRQRRQGPH